VPIPNPSCWNINGRKIWRRGSESNRRIKVLQTSPLPLGYRAPSDYVSVPGEKSPTGEGEAIFKNVWSGRRGSNPRHRPWQGRALPLSYSRSTSLIITKQALRGNDLPTAVERLDITTQWHFYTIFQRARWLKFLSAGSGVAEVSIERQQLQTQTERAHVHMLARMIAAVLFSRRPHQPSQSLALPGRSDRKHAKTGRLSSQLHLDAGNCLPVALCYQNVCLGMIAGKRSAVCCVRSRKVLIANAGLIRGINAGKSLGLVRGHSDLMRLQCGAHCGSSSGRTTCPSRM
jgi:hypothetical protein